MKVRLNGEDIVVLDGLSLSDLLSGMRISSDAVVVEHNRKILSLKDFSSIFLKEGDSLEIVSFVGGG